MGIEEIILEETRKEGKLEEKIQMAYNSWKADLSIELTARLIEFSVEKVIELFSEFASKSTKE